MPKRNLIPEAIELVERYESLRLFAYPDPKSPLHEKSGAARRRWGFEPAAVILASLPVELRALDGKPWTCGYGHTGASIGVDTTCTREQADKWLDDDLDGAQDAVESLLTPEALNMIDDCAYGALTSAMFNIGAGNLRTSTLFRKVNLLDMPGAALEFRKWNKAENRETGKLEVMPGLTIRRAAEEALFIRDLHQDHPTATAQVATPAPKPFSRIIAGSVTAGAGTIGTQLTEAATQFQSLSQYVPAFKTIFIILAVAGTLFAIWAKMQDRNEERG